MTITQALPATVHYSNGKRLWDWILRFTVPVVALAAGTLVAHELRINAVETSRFSDRDGILLEQRLNTEVLKCIKEFRKENGELLRGLDARLRNIEIKVGNK